MFILSTQRVRAWLALALFALSPAWLGSIEAQAGVEARQTWFREELAHVLRSPSLSEREDARRALSLEAQKRITSQSDELKLRFQKEAADRRAIVAEYDVVVIGAGPHSAILNVELSAHVPSLSILNIEATPHLGGAFADKGDTFYINSPELGNRSANEIPGAPAKLSELTDARFARADALRDVVVFTQAASRADFLLETSVRSLEKVNGSESGVIITTNAGHRVRASRVIIATGLGSPRFDGKDLGTQKLLGKSRGKVRAGETYPDIQFSDELLARVQAQTDQGLPALQSLKGKRVAVVGPGDAGNIWVEALLGQGPEKLYGNALRSPKTEIQVQWIGQSARTVEEFKSANKARYHATFDSLFEDPNLVRSPGRLESINKLRGPQIEYQLNYRLPDGTLKSLTADKIILCTGYSNNVTGLLRGLGKTTLRPLVDEVATLGLTRVGVQVLDAAGSKLGIYVAGPAAGALATTQELERTITKNAVSINALSLRTQVLGRVVADSFRTDWASATDTIVSDGTLANLRQTMQGGGEWINRWAAEGRSHASLEVEALAKSLRERAARGYFIPHLEMSELTWDGSHWSVNQMARARAMRLKSPEAALAEVRKFARGLTKDATRSGTMAELGRALVRHLK